MNREGKRNPWQLILGAVLLFAAAPLAARVSVGTAYSLDGERVLYRERRVEEWRDGALVACEVDYLTPDGELFAEKSIRFESGRTTPEFTFVDYREQFREGARTEPGVVELFSGAGDSLESRRAELPEAPVIDAGFDQFIRDNFERLAAGERLAFDFAVPAEQRFVRFEIERSGAVEYDGRAALALRMRPANVLFRLLVDPIRLVYDAQRRLLEFAGISDIRDDSGERYQARIVFDYSPDSTPPADTLGAG